MFTGIIKELGIVRKINKIADLYRLEIESKSIFKNVNMGESVSINGTCLTLVEKNRNALSFDIMSETVRKTNLIRLKNRELINLENSLKASEAVGGHFVLGHIDCLGKIRDIAKNGPDVSLEIEFPKEFKHLVVEKGSIAIDGVSLTTVEVKEDGFRVCLIPHTLKTTTLGSKSTGDELNLEFDIIGKYIARFSNKEEKELGKSSKLTEDFLMDKGFI